MKTGEKILEALTVISPRGEEELLSYLPLIESEAQLTEKRLEEVGEEYEAKAVMLAAARVNYKLALISQSSDKIKSFKAGDVSLSEGNEALVNAKALLDEISADCPELAGHDGFEFKTV